MRHRDPWKHEHDFVKIMVRSILLQVTSGRQIGLRGGPPLGCPETPLTSDISGSNSSNEEFLTSTPIVFDVLSCGIYGVSPTCREPSVQRHIFVKSGQDDEKSRFIESTQDHEGNI